MDTLLDPLARFTPAQVQALKDSEIIWLEQAGRERVLLHGMKALRTIMGPDEPPKNPEEWAKQLTIAVDNDQQADEVRVAVVAVKGEAEVAVCLPCT